MGKSSNPKLTRDRSAANAKYEFRFIGNSRMGIVPVLNRYAQGYRFIGTASLIIRPNIFITTAHLFEGNDIPEDSTFYIQSEKFSDYPFEIIEVQKHQTLDLAFLVMEREGEEYFSDVNPLAVMNLPPEKNEIVAIFGYSHSSVDPDDVVEEGNELLQPMQIRSKWELGGVLDIHKEGRGFVKGECYETSILAEGGDSGAPMFNSNGFLVGLLSRAFDFEDGLPNSTCVSILNLAEIPINGIPFKKLWNKNKRGVFCRLKKDEKDQ